MNQIRHLGFTAPDDLRERLDGVSRSQLAPPQHRCDRPRARTRSCSPPRPHCGSWAAACCTSTRRWSSSTVSSTNSSLRPHRDARPLRRRHRHRRPVVGRCGQQSRTTPLRAGVGAPVWRVADPGVVGKTVRHRLNRGGDRQANHALWRITLVRMSHDPSRPRLRHPPSRRGQDQTRDHADPQALHRTRGLQDPAPRLRPVRAAGLTRYPAAAHPGWLSIDLSARCSSTTSPRRRDVNDGLIRACPRPARVAHPCPARHPRRRPETCLDRHSLDTPTGDVKTPSGR